MDKIISRERGMICGSYEAEIRRYTKHLNKNNRPGFWLVADQPNAGDNVYYYSGDPKSQGFAGRTIQFILVDGTILDLVGPWHGNTESLFIDTGYDIRNRHLTYVVIAKGRKYGGYGKSIYIDVLYEDEEPLIGLFNRGEILAKEYANKLGQTVFCYRRSSGGSSDGPVEPDREAPCQNTL